MEYKFTSENFEKEVLRSNTPVMLDFYADWCPHCKAMDPVVKNLAEKYDGQIKIGKINSDEEAQIAAQFGVQSIPNFVFLKNGKIADQVAGAMPPAVLEQKLKNLL